MKRCFIMATTKTWIASSASRCSAPGAPGFTPMTFSPLPQILLQSSPILHQSWVPSFSFFDVQSPSLATTAFFSSWKSYVQSQGIKCSSVHERPSSSRKSTASADVAGERTTLFFRPNLPLLDALLQVALYAAADGFSGMRSKHKTGSQSFKLKLFVRISV